MLTCPMCQGSDDCLRSLCEEHLKNLAPPSDEEILRAFEQGRRDFEAARHAYVPFIGSGLRYR